jgi:hypothetical protein
VALAYMLFVRVAALIVEAAVAVAVVGLALLLLLLCACVYTNCRPGSCIVVLVLCSGKV